MCSLAWFSTVVRDVLILDDTRTKLAVINDDGTDDDFDYGDDDTDDKIDNDNDENHDDDDGGGGGGDGGGDGGGGGGRRRRRHHHHHKGVCGHHPGLAQSVHEGAENQKRHRWTSATVYMPSVPKPTVHPL